MKNDFLTTCFLTQTFPDDDKSYRGIFIKNLAMQLVKKGYRIIVVTPRIFKKSRKLETDGGITVYRFAFPSGEKPLISYRRIPIFRMLLYMIACTCRSFKAMSAHSCQLIHVHWIHPNGIIGVLIKVLYRRPLIIHVRGSDFNLFATRNRFFRVLTQFILKHADYILCTSESSRLGLIEAFKSLEGKQIHVVYNTIDTSHFHPIPEQEARRALGISPHKFHLLFVGNLTEEKGILELVNAVKKLPEELKGKFSFHIIGTGPLEKTLEAHAYGEIEAEIVILHGPVTHSQIPLYLNAANLLVLPSKNEGTPNVVLEALYCGTPVLATNVGDVPRLIQEGENGYLIDVRDKGARLREILQNILEEPEGILMMKKQMRQNMDRPISKNRLTVEQIYTSLLKNRPHA